VDDEESILQSLTRIFKNHFQVLTANSAEIGLGILKDHDDCAVILTDFRMPEMSGIEFLRFARKLVPNAARAMLSGQIDMQQISDAINSADIHKFVMKPWENDRLLLHMLEAVQIHSTLNEKRRYQVLSVTDPVTQLTNHRYFQDSLRAELEKAESGGTSLFLLMIDVDNFKRFNDHFGHPEGDRLLFATAHRLKTLVGDRGSVSRYGGEEFGVLLPGWSAAQATELGETIRHNFERTPMAGLSAGATYITLSIGMAGYPDHGASAKELVEMADRALYQAKRQGRNQLQVASFKVS
jgi:diguanylate cyclase (GGDEF)-like protein